MNFDSITEILDRNACEWPNDTALAETNPPEALTLIMGFAASFPAEGKEYKEEIRELTVAAKEYVAAQKAKAAEAKKAKK